MFVVSIKSSSLKKVGVLSLAIVFAVIGGVYAVNANSSKPVANLNGIVMSAQTAEERVAFLSQFGWEIDEEPIEVKEIVIPEKFDDVYIQYNDLQNSQNLDLSKYKGARVKLYKYSIKNYPGYENSKDLIQANILVLDGVVIGGDVSNVELNGFMHTFEKK